MQNMDDKDLMFRWNMMKDCWESHSATKKCIIEDELIEKASKFCPSAVKESVLKKKDMKVPNQKNAKERAHQQLLD